MQIRKANSTDISQIVEVLDLSMGNSSDLPVSEKVWNYKHIENTFGKSLVLVAEEHNKIIGVRAFMAWKWQQNNKSFKAFRAVDTATHPDFQGKGIFKNLTLKALEESVGLGYEFVFNTPNDLSRPGYLKMGWKEAGKLKVGLTPSFSTFLNFSSVKEDYKISPGNVSQKQIEDLSSIWNRDLRKTNRIFTPKSVAFLKWRYENNPLQKYEVCISENLYLAGYVKKRGKLKELRIAECIYNDNNALKEIRKVINKWCSKFGVQVISFSPQVNPLYKFSFKGNIGPILTYRSLHNSQKQIENFFPIDNWAYALGDLELF